MSAFSVPQDSMEAVRAAVDPPSPPPSFTRPHSLFRLDKPSAAALIEGVLLHDPATAQRALAALIADEVEIADPGGLVVALWDGRWAVEMPQAEGSRYGIVVAPRVDRADVDGVVWEVWPRSADGGVTQGAVPLLEEQLGLCPTMVFEVLDMLSGALV